MTEVCSVYVVFASRAEAERIGRAMIAAGEAACVNLFGACQSIYRWQGAVEQAEEVPALFKTRTERLGSLIEAIRSLHSYETPAIVAWPIMEGAADYIRWIKEETA